MHRQELEPEELEELEELEEPEELDVLLGAAAEAAAGVDDVDAGVDVDVDALDVFAPVFPDVELYKSLYQPPPLR